MSAQCSRLICSFALSLVLTVPTACTPVSGTALVGTDYPIVLTKLIQIKDDAAKAIRSISVQENTQVSALNEKVALIAKQASAALDELQRQHSDKLAVFLTAVSRNIEIFLLAAQLVYWLAPILLGPIMVAMRNHLVNLRQQLFGQGYAGAGLPVSTDDQGNPRKNQGSLPLSLLSGSVGWRTDN